MQDHATYTLNFLTYLYMLSNGRTNLVVFLPLCPLPVAAAGTARPLAVVAVPLSVVPLAVALAVVVARVVLFALSGVAAWPEIVNLA